MLRIVKSIVILVCFSLLNVAVMDSVPSFAPSFHVMQVLFIPYDHGINRIHIVGFALNIGLSMVLINMIVKRVDELFAMSCYILTRTSPQRAMLLQIWWIFKQIVWILTIKLFAYIMFIQNIGQLAYVLWFTLVSILTIAFWIVCVHTLKIIHISNKVISSVCLFLIVLFQYLSFYSHIPSVFIMGSSFLLDYPWLCMGLKILLLTSCLFINQYYAKSYQHIEVKS